MYLIIFYIDSADIFVARAKPLKDKVQRVENHPTVFMQAFQLFSWKVESF